LQKHASTRWAHWRSTHACPPPSLASDPSHRIRSGATLGERSRSRGLAEASTPEPTLPGSREVCAVAGRREIVVRSTHRGLRYVDGRFDQVLDPGRYTLPRRYRWARRQSTVDIVLVDMRQREFTIKGQEILTADKVAVRVSIITQF